MSIGTYLRGLLHPASRNFLRTSRYCRANTTNPILISALLISDILCLIALLLDHDVRMTSYLRPASVLSHPNCREAKMRGFSCIRHLSGPHNGLAAGNNSGVPFSLPSRFVTAGKSYVFDSLAALITCDVVPPYAWAKASY